MKDVSQLYKALADETRLRILNLLLQGELCICELMEILDMTQSKVSRHMAYLRHSGIVNDRREAVWVYYSLAEPKTKVHKCQLKCIQDCFDEYEILKKDLEKLKKIKAKKACVS